MNSLNCIVSLIDKTFPIPGKYRSKLPSDIAELSRLLTGARGDRALSYLGRPNFLSAYLRYFLPWNIVRLCSLLPSLELSLNAGDSILDIGSGPLTFASALWICRPDLQTVPLEIFCVDRSFPALEAGRIFFNVLSGNNSSWKIHLVKEDMNFNSLNKKNKILLQRRSSLKFSLVSAVNLFNEIYESLPHNNTTGLRRMADNIANFMHNLAAKEGRILTVEPGVPQSGRFISFLRTSFMEIGRFPLSPCTHEENCPACEVSGNPRKKTRWCHFAYETKNAPKELHKLSSAAGLPKERLVLSYIYAGEEILKKTEARRTQKKKDVRVISDVFALPYNRFGCYGCCSTGLVLLTGDKKQMEKMSSGKLVRAEDLDLSLNKRDTKSGAPVLEVK